MKRCPACKGRKHMRYFLKGVPGRRGWADGPFAGMKRCKDAFHGPSWGGKK